MNEGAKYYKCDFQVHSPRDLQFTGQAYITDDERREYSKKFIKACREKNIHSVAITDHHDLCFYPYIKEASQIETDAEGNPIHEQNRIVVFPGLELTLDVPCQALLIFDSTLEITDELTIKIYTTLSIQNQNAKSESKTSPINRLPFRSINDVYEKLNSIEILKGRFIVFPNIKEGGGDSILRTGFHNEYANGLFVGGYLDRGQFESHKVKLGWNNIINGKIEAYGNRSIGVFQTSDNRIETFDHLGISASWVKWSVPTAEALRQACLAKKSRILQEEPKLPLTRISNVKISKSSFLKDIGIEFNPQFNVLIGGRGSGKSSLLQYISWALGKDAEPEKKIELDKFIKNTLTGGAIELTVIKNGISHVINRTIDEYQLKIGEDAWQKTNSQNIVSIIRADSFAQKELSKHEKNRTTQLTKIIENTVDSGVESIRRQLEGNANRIKEVAASFESYLANRKSYSDLKNQIDSIEEQIKSLNKQLNDVPTGDKEIIKDNSLIAYEKNLIKNSELQIGGISNLVTAILSKGDFNSMLFEESGIKNLEVMKTLSLHHDEVIKTIKFALEETLAKATSTVLDETKKALIDLHRSHDAAYVEARARQTKFEEIFKEIEELRKRLGILVDDRQRVQETLSKLKGTIKQLQKLFFERNQLNLVLYKLIKGAVVDVVGKSEGSIEIELTSLGNIEHIIQKFLSSVTSSKGQPERTSGFFKGLIKGNNTYKKLLKFWLSIYRW
jgi:chromosome segregation protein